MNIDLTAAERFVWRCARLLERRLYACLFLGGPGEAVADALRGYRNDDGGFGHALEPDKRCPDSLPIDVEVALQTLVAAGTVDVPMVTAACDYLQRTASEAGAGGAVPLALPVIEGYPRAEHWSDWTYRPGLNPTAGLVGLLHRLGVEHPWRDEAERWCWHELETGELPDDAHALAEVLVFLEHVPDTGRADRLATAVVDRLRSASYFKLDPDAPGYGLSPLQVAPLATSRWRGLFTPEQVSAHLAHLAADQQDDGGWPITWQPPGPAAELEWRGVVTVGALRTLRSYGRASRV